MKRKKSYRLHLLTDDELNHLHNLHFKDCEEIGQAIAANLENCQQLLERASSDRDLSNIYVRYQLLSEFAAIVGLKRLEDSLGELGKAISQKAKEF